MAKYFGSQEREEDSDAELVNLFGEDSTREGIDDGVEGECGAPCGGRQLMQWELLQSVSTCDDVACGSAVDGWC